MKFGNSEIKKNTNDTLEKSFVQNTLERMQKLVEWNTQEKLNELERVTEVFSGKDIVTEAWRDAFAEINENKGIKAIDAYISENYERIVAEMRDNKAVMALRDVYDDIKTLKIPEIVQTVVYFYMWKYNIAMMALGYIGKLSDSDMLSVLNVGGDNVAKEISAMYKDIVTPDYMKKYHDGEEILPAGELAAQLSELTEKSVEAVCYLSSELILGVGEVVEDAVSYAVAGIADLTGKDEIRNSVFSRSFTRELAGETEQCFQGNIHIKEAGKIVEEVGAVGTYIALGVLATGTGGLGAVPTTVAVGANVILGLAKAGQTTREISELSGETNRKDLICGAGGGILAVVSTQVAAWLTGRIHEVYEAAAVEIQQSGTNMAGAKMLLKEIEGAAAEGAAGGAVFSSQDVYRNLLSSAFDENEDIDWKKLLSEVEIDIAEGAAFGVLFYMVGEFVKDVTAMKNYDGELGWMERIRIKLETGWDNRVIKYIKNMEQYEIYKNAGLHQEIIGGRLCLCREIDYDYVSLKTIDDKHPHGISNRELMKNGRAPYDAKTGEKIELHHMGQAYDSPFAELLENSEHGDGKDAILHDKGMESWRRVPELKKQYNNVDRPGHWRERTA